MPSLADLEKLIPVGTAVAQGINNSGAVNTATGNLAAGANQAMGTITDAQKAAQGTLDATHVDSQGLLRPYQAAGTEALNSLQSGLKPGGGMADPFQWLPADLQNDPIFQRRLKQGQDAIAAKANAGGTRFSGASMKDFADYATGSANDYLAQDYARQEGTFRANQADAFNRNLALEQQGQGAVTQGVNENTNYGTNTVGLTVGTSKSIAELQTEKASALASGNLAQARVIDNLISGATDALSPTSLASAKVPQVSNPFPAAGSPLQNPQAPPGTDPFSLTPEGGTNPYGQAPSSTPNSGGQGSYNPTSGSWEAPLAGGVTAATGAALAGGGAAAAVPAVSVAIPELGIGGAATAGIGSAAAGEGAASGAASGIAGGGSTGIAGLGNLIPIAGLAVGAALIGSMIWKSTQVHRTTDKWTPLQTQFGQHLSSIVNGFDQGLQNGQMTKAQAQLAYQQTSSLIQDVEQKASEFAQAKGSKGQITIDQFHREMTKDFGPNYAGILQKMQQEIQGMAAQ